MGSFPIDPSSHIVPTCARCNQTLNGEDAGELLGALMLFGPGPLVFAVSPLIFRAQLVVEMSTMGVMARRDAFGAAGRRGTLWRVSCGIAVGIMLASCYRAHEASDLGDSDTSSTTRHAQDPDLPSVISPEPEGWRPPEHCCRDGSVASHPPMDVLLVIDDSQSMEPAQRALSRALPAFFFELLAGAGFPAPSSLRIGVVTSSDAALPVVRGPLGTGCMLRAAEPRWFAFPSSDLPTLPALMDAIECAAAPGTNGNMVEQPLEAAANQLTRTSDFFRAEAVTFVFFVTDEDDCSLLPGSSELRLDDRCKHSDELQPLDRYIRAFEGFRPHGHAIYALLGPLPPDEEDPDPQALLEHPFMQWEDGRSHGGAVRIVRVLHESASASSVLASIYECVDPEEYCRGRRRPHDLEPSFLDRRVHVHDCNQNHPCPAYDLRTDLDDLEPIWRRVGEPLTASGCGDP